MLRSRWIVYDNITGQGVSVESGLRPIEEEGRTTIEHLTARFLEDAVNLTTFEIEPYIEPIDEKAVRNEFITTRTKILAKSTIEYEGMVFDSDETSQNRMLRPIAVLQNDTDTQMWVLHNNSVVYLTKPQFIAVLALAGQQQTDIWVQT